MITYELSCENGHRFEGWFANREGFEEQLSKGLISCPLCESTKVKKLPSAFAVHVGRTTAAPPPEAPKNPTPQAVGSYLRALADFVEKNFEDVGPRFADEARKIQTGEAEARSIRGVTTEAEEEALKEEGVDFVKVALPKYDA